MKIQDIFDITVKYAGELAGSSFGQSPFYKGIGVGLATAMQRKGSGWITSMPVAQNWLAKLESIGVYDPATGEVDDEAFFAFVEGYVNSGSNLPLGVFEVPNVDLQLWVKRLKEVGYGQHDMLPGQNQGVVAGAVRR
jgi:hypothetical protein